MAKELDRTKTGVPGLDELLSGGIPKGNLVVISGDPGSGKTSMVSGFLYYGAIKYSENGVYISLEETVKEVIEGAENYGFDFRKQVDAGKIKVIYIDLYDFEKLRNTIEDSILSMNAKRVVIDPGVIFKLFFEKELDARKNILSLGRMLKKMGVTAIITNEINLDGSRSLFGLEEYVADGVILLYHTKMENKFVRSVAILKMRGTKISEKLHPLIIDKDGVRVLSKQELFEEV